MMNAPVNLHLGTTEDRDKQSRYYGCDDSLLWRHTRSYTKRYGKWQGYNAYYDTCHDIC